MVLQWNIQVAEELFDRLEELIQRYNPDPAYQTGSLFSLGEYFPEARTYLGLSIGNEDGKPLIVRGYMGGDGIGETYIHLHQRSLNESFKVTFSNNAELHIRFVKTGSPNKG